MANNSAARRANGFCTAGPTGFPASVGVPCAGTSVSGRGSLDLFCWQAIKSQPPSKRLAIMHGNFMVSVVCKFMTMLDGVADESDLMALLHLHLVLNTRQAVFFYRQTKSWPMPSEAVGRKALPPGKRTRRNLPSEAASHRADFRKIEVARWLLNALCLSFTNSFILLAIG